MFDMNTLIFLLHHVPFSWQLTERKLTIMVKNSWKKLVVELENYVLNSKI